MIKTVYFDLGNVLVLFCHKKMFRQIGEVTGLSLAEIQKILIEEKAQDEYETGKIKTEELYTRFARKGRKSFSLLEFMDAASDIFTPNDSVFPIIHELKKQKIRLILLSNTNDCHFNRIYSHYPILQQFDDFILSFVAGACKPNPLIFQKALSLANCHKSECFYTDDIPEFVNAAKKEGLDAELFTDAPSLKNHLANRGIELSPG